MGFVRSIGRWSMTALVINCIIGSGIFGLPSELNYLLGNASPIAMIAGALLMAIVMACIVEVASQFSDPGGPYLYVRTAFGRFAGLQIGWFWLLAAIGGGAANASLFVAYLGGIWPFAATSIGRTLVLAVLVLVPTLLNIRGVKSGATFSNVLTVAKLLPLVLLIVLGVFSILTSKPALPSGETVRGDWTAWLAALSLLVFAYGGYENTLAPTGEVRDPHRTIPFGLIVGMSACAIVYALVQFVTVSLIGTTPTERPLATTAGILLGSGGSLFVAIAVMISTYGWVSGNVLNAPRIFYALSASGDAPEIFARLNPRFSTPIFSISIYAVLVWVLASTGSYLWVLALTAGSIMILYSGTCAALIRFRKTAPNAMAIRVPFGPVLAVFSIGLLIALLTQLHRQQLLLMGVTALLATLNWAWARRLPANQPIAAEPKLPAEEVPTQAKPV